MIVMNDDEKWVRFKFNVHLLEHIFRDSFASHVKTIIRSRSAQEKIAEQKFSVCIVYDNACKSI